MLLSFSYIWKSFPNHDKPWVLEMLQRYILFLKKISLAKLKTSKKEKYPDSIKIPEFIFNGKKEFKNT